MNRLSIRWVFALGFAGCLFAMLFAAGYLQRVLGLEPCPLCVVQRVAMVATGAVFLLGAILAPASAVGRWAIAGLASATALAGAGVAGRHVWLQNLPADQVPACGPTLEYLIDVLPFTEVLTTVLRGDGNCALIDAQWLGISLPGWTLVAFVGLTLYALAAPLVARKEAA
jgi:protein dithiol:quinone oxidoreductase